MDKVFFYSSTFVYLLGELRNNEMGSFYSRTIRSGNLQLEKKYFKNTGQKNRIPCSPAKHDFITNAHFSSFEKSLSKLTISRAVGIYFALNMFSYPIHAERITNM